MAFYAGIGSRETPPIICAQMTEIAKYLDKYGFILRSGHAPGAYISRGQNSKGVLLRYSTSPMRPFRLRRGLIPGGII